MADLEFWMRIYLLLALIAFVISSLVQGNDKGRRALAPPAPLGDNDWSLARGWQVEISIWNFGTSIIIMGALMSSDPTILKFAIAGVVALTVGFGTNHLRSYLESQLVPDWHLYVGVINLIGTMIGVILLVVSLDYIPKDIWGRF